MYIKELLEIARIHQQLSSVIHVDFYRSLQYQQEIFNSLKPAIELNALITEYTNRLVANRPIPQEVFDQIEKERILICSFKESHRPIIEAIDKIRFSPIWDQIQVASALSELIGWHEPHKKIWENISKKLDLISPAFGISIGLIEDTDQPNLFIRDYKITGSEDSKRQFPVPVIKDVVGLPYLIKDINHSDAIEFLNFLSKYPMLGLYHKVGKKLINAIHRIEKKQLTDIYLYRGRQWDDSQQLPYVEDQLFQPPFGIPYQGRFNPHGLATLYFSDSKDSVISELCVSKGQKVTIIKVRILRPLNIIDLTADTSPIISLCNKPISNKSNTNTEYLIPNYISQCCKYHHIDGIAYQSVNQPIAQNYAFFDIHKDSFEVVDLINDV